MTKPRLSKTAKLFALCLLSCAALLPAARAQTTWIIDTGSTTFPLASDVIGEGDIIKLFMNPTGGGPSGNNALIAFVAATPPPSFTLQSGDGNWYSITNSKVAANGATRAIAANSGTSTITLINVTFLNNHTTSGNGAAIQFVAAGAAVTDMSTITGTAAFIGNGGSNTGMLGGAIHNAAGAFTLSGSFLFQGNYAGRGGAINTAATAGNDYIYGDILFQSNTTVGTGNNNGGAFNFQQYQTSTAFFNGNIQFINNYALGGGGAFASNINQNATPSQAWVYFSGTTLFSGNITPDTGGAIQQGGQGLVIGGNTQFINNTAGLQGGAIYLYNFKSGTAVNASGSQAIGGNSLTLDATTGDIVFQGNIENTGANLANPGDHNAINAYSGTYNTANTGSTNILLNTGAGGNTIYFYDPISISNTAQLGNKQNKVNVTVTGNGTVLFDASLNSNNSFINGLTNVQSGLFKLANGATYTNVGTAANGAFTLQATATLAAAGAGNLLGAPTITLAANSSLLLDLAGATSTSDPLLTLNATTLNPNAWAQNLTLLDLATLTLASGNTVNLITLTGAGATNAANHFTTANVATLLANTTGLTGDYSLMPSTDGLSLLLLYGTYVPSGNNVLTWTGATGTSWLGVNWLAAGSPASYLAGDIVNLADDTTGAPAPVAATTINVDTPGGAQITAMYISGTTNYTITGTAITATATTGTFTHTASPAAATGQLVLGAKATDDAGTLDTTAAAAYTGTLTLANTTNNFQGGILINSGALAGNAAQLGSGTGGIAIGAAGTLIFDQAPAATYTAAISSLAPGAGALVKTNTGALTLAANNSAYTGMTTVNAGALLLAANAALGGNIAINTAATFGGSGTAGNVTVNTGATLQVGLGTQDFGLGTPTLTLTSNLNLLDGSLLNYTNINNTLLLGGAIAQTGATTLDIATISTGSHSLIDSLGGLAGFQTSLLTLTYKGALYDTADYRFDTDGNLLWLTILHVQLGANSILTWTGAAADGLWLTSTNWNAFGIDKTFAQGDIVNLTGASPATLAIADSATAAAIYVNGNTSYTLTGAGDLVADATASELAGDAAATGKLVLGKNAIDQDTIATAAFTGTLDLTNPARTGANTFTGGVEIASGALRISTPAQLGAPLGQLQFTGSPDTPGALLIAADMLIDDNYDITSPNRLVVGSATTPGAGAIIAEPGVTLTISHGTNTADGGAITISPLSTLILSGTANGPGGSLLFDSNLTGNRGGAIFVSNSAAVIIDSATFTNNQAAAIGAGKGGAISADYSGTVIVRDSVFTNNLAGTGNQGNGGAIAGQNGAAIIVTDVLFTSNTATGLGGAIFNNSAGAQLTIASSTFINNIAIGNDGGAVAAQSGNNAGPLVDIKDTLFDGNQALATGGAGQGGGLWFAASITGAIANTIFQNNTADLGGGFALGGANGTATLTDVSFYNNTARTDGGAIYMSGNNSALTYNISASQTSRIAGNTAPAGAGIYISNNSNYTLTINTAPGALLDMQDPLYVYMANTQTTAITKTGAGTWNFGGSATLAPANSSPNTATVNFTVAQGALHLYRAGEITYNGAPVAAGNILNSDTGSFASAPRGTLNFTLAPNATLSIGGGNTIAATTITLGASSNLIFDLTGATPDSAPLLTLGAATTLNPNAWTQNLTLLNPLPTLTDGDAICLITLTGATNSSNTFNATTIASLTANTTGLFGDYSLVAAPNGLNLLLVYGTYIAPVNHVLAWTGAAGNNLWSGSNWLAAGAPATYRKGDIINLADIPGVTPSVTSTLNIDTPAGATIAGMYASGAASYTITGNALTIATAAGDYFDGVTTNQLVLGAQVTDTTGATATAAYTGTLTLANTSNNFQNGIIINTGALRASNTAQLGTTLGKLQFAGTGALIAAANDAGDTMTFDGANTGVNRLLIGTGAKAITATIIAEPGATFAINHSTGASGGAINLAPNATLILTGTANGAGGNLLFTSNTSTGLGGAIYVTDSTSTLTIDNATFDNNRTGSGAQSGGAIAVEGGGSLTVRDSAFTNNNTGIAGNSQANGGAISGRFGAILDISNVLFANNTANGIGGAIFNNTKGAQVLVATSTFTANATTNGGGGAIGAQMPSGSGLDAGIADIRDSLFLANTAVGNGGAIWFSVDWTGTIANSTFTGNSANNGGAISLGGDADSITLVDTSFYDNTARANGGAIQLTGSASTLNILVTDNNTARYAGNTATANATPNSIYINNNNGIRINIDTAPGATLEMLDPLAASISNSTTVAITKTGAGAWNLGGQSTFASALATAPNLFIDINEGALHLYRAGEVTYNDTPVTAGSLLVTDVPSQPTPRALIHFTLKNGATLSAGGGNTINLTTITLEPRATIALDFIDAATADTGYSLLTLGVTGTGNAPLLAPNGWVQNLSLLNIDYMAPSAGDTFNLITIAGGGAFTTPDTFNLLAPIPDGYHLQLTDDLTTLQLVCDYYLMANRVLTWGGASAQWIGANWTAAGAPATFRIGDIVNLAPDPDSAPAADPAAPIAINVNTNNGLTLAGLYVSGTDNYTITGGPITAAADASPQFIDTPAATGKLILGAYAPDANTLLTSDLWPLTSGYTGTLTLANNNNNFTAGIEINPGATLVGNASNLAPAETGNPGITIAPGATLILDQPADATFATRLAGSGAFIKTNAGALTFDADFTAFTGPTTIAAGALLLTENVTLAGDITVAPDATLGAAPGATAGNVTLDTGATLQIGLPNSTTTQQTINLSTLTLSDNSILNYLGADTQLRIATPVTLDPTSTITLNTAPVPTGTYNLGNLGSIYDNIQLTVNGIIQAPDARQHAGLIHDGDDLLIAAYGDISRILYWTSDANDTWATTGSAWDNNDPAAPTHVFGHGDQVRFGYDNTDPGIISTIAISGEVLVSDMYVTGTTDYTFTGGNITADPTTVYAGDILTPDEATGKLYKTGASTLTLANTTNNFTGGIELQEGTLALAARLTTTPTLAAGADTTLQMAGGVLNAAQLTFAPSSTLTGYGSITGITNLNDTITADIGTYISGTDTILGTLAIDGAVAGSGGWRKTGPGTLRLNSPAALLNTGPTQIDQGTLNINNITGNSLIYFLSTPELTITATDGYIIVPSATYNIMGENFIVPGRNVVAIPSDAGTTWTIPVFTDTINGAVVTAPRRTVTINPDGTEATVSSVDITTTGSKNSTSVTQQIILNGGILSFNTGGDSIANNANLTDAGNANDWTGITFDQGPNAAQSTISGLADIIHIGSGTFLPAIQDGIYVAIDAGDGATVLANSKNDFNGQILLNSGTLQVTATNQIGWIGGTGNTNKILLYGGTLEFSTNLTTARSLQIRGPSATIAVDEGLTVTWNAIRNDNSSPATDIIKTGLGTYINTAACDATDMHVLQGEYRALAANGAAVRVTTVAEDALFHFQIPSSVATGNPIGWAAGEQISTQGSAASSFTGSGTLSVTNSTKMVLSGAKTDIAHFSITQPNTVVVIDSNQHIDFCNAPDSQLYLGGGMLVLAAPTVNMGDVDLHNGARLAFLMQGTWVATGTNKQGQITTPAHLETQGMGFKSATIRSLTTSGTGGGTIWFNTNLAFGRADHLTITNPVTTGSYTIGISPIVGTSDIWEASNTGTYCNPVDPAFGIPTRYYAPIEILNMPAESTADFTIATPRIDLGLYSYTVTSATTSGAISVLITGTGAMSNNASFINQMAAMMPMTFLTELDSVTQRLGELHFEQRDGKAGLSAWMRGYGEQVNYNTKLSGYAFDERKYGAEAGVDYKFGGSMYNVYAGAFAGYGRSERFYTVDGNGDIESAYAGLYQTFSAPSGWYVDGLLKMNNFKNRFTAYAPTGESTNADYHNWAAGASLEFGKYCDLNYGWFMTPSIQGAFTVVTDKNYTTDSGMSVEQRASAITRARAGFQFGRIYETQKHGTLNIYIKLYGGGQWMTDGQLLITVPAPINQSARYAPAIKGYYLEGGAGLAWQFSKLTQFYFDYDTTQAEYYIKPWSINGGVRFTW